MVLDSLRYWVEHMHVDGFRFDLATVLARTEHGFDPECAFLTELANDPVLGAVKLIAEPWDVGLGGYQLGHFPAPWSEWNDQYRQTMRSYWLHNGDRGSLAHALSGSRDSFFGANRSAQASINYLCAHDGFTLHDLTAYNEKHNEANGESNRDGNNANQSWNCGAEGESDLLGVLSLRARLQRAMLASLFLSRGVPMLMAGDEMGRTQRGNNNAYCQDNDLSWLQWTQADAALTDFVARLIALRRGFDQFSTEQWPSKATAEFENGNNTSIEWIDASGNVLEAQDWNQDDRLLGMISAGTRPLLVVFNPVPQDCDFSLPGGQWRLILNTALREPFGPFGVAGESGSVSAVSESFTAIGRAVIVFERTE
jgi:glycogen operon protein